MDYGWQKMADSERQSDEFVEFLRSFWRHKEIEEKHDALNADPSDSTATVRG